AALNNDRKTRVVILTGEGRGFCSGADLQEEAAPGAIPGTDGMGEVGFVYRFQEYLMRAVLAIHECDKPVIAAINGVTVGGGLSMALAADVRIASDQARFGAVYIKTGLSGCDVGSSYFLPRIVGAGIAAELLLTGRIFDAAEAREIRLVNRVVSAENLHSAALEQARAIRENSEYGVWMTKKGLQSAIDAPSLRQAMEMENRTQVLGYFTGCMTAMREAFVKGERPVWPKL
ncbi:MAG: putative enoyl-CoA hydratase echA12, partial [Pseudomonadota bacterium]